MVRLIVCLLLFYFFVFIAADSGVYLPRIMRIQYKNWHSYNGLEG